MENYKYHCIGIFMEFPTKLMGWISMKGNLVTKFCNALVCVF
jgi:hypothetical protein